MNVEGGNRDARVKTAPDALLWFACPSAQAHGDPPTWLEELGDSGFHYALVDLKPLEDE
jgi:hypothetical protein